MLNCFLPHPLQLHNLFFLFLDLFSDPILLFLYAELLLFLFLGLHPISFLFAAIFDDLLIVLAVVGFLRKVDLFVSFVGGGLGGGIVELIDGLHYCVLV
jgi:hypothetical protein